MKKALLIAEKPAIMRDIQSAYRKIEDKLSFKIDFTALRGYFVGLKNPESYNPEWGKPWNLDVLPMIPEKFTFEVNDDVRMDYNFIKDKLLDTSYDFVINACDAGREGQSIFWSFYEHAGGKIPVKRLWVSDTTEEAFIKGLNNLIDENTSIKLKNLKDSAFYRMHMDWLLGMNLSRAITLKTNKLIPVGRVMTPTLNIVVQRDLEISNFKPETTYEVVANFGKYKGIWFDEETNETRFKDKDKAQKFIDKLGKKGTVSSVETKRERRQAPPNYSLGDLQRDANEMYGFTAKDTLGLAQSLYETHKLLTYPRTESRALSTSMGKEIDKHLKAVQDIPEVEKYVKKILGDRKIIDKTIKSKRYINDAELTDHHAIIPTKRKPNLSALSDKEKKLYLLVVKRFVSIFLEPELIDKTTIVTDVDLEGNIEKFKTTGSVLVSLGYKELYGRMRRDDEIPSVKKGEVYDVKDYEIVDKVSTPPPYYNDSTLIGAMTNAGRFVEEEELKTILRETAGLGTVATRHSIIEKLINVKMLTRKGKSIRATEFGFKVIEILDGREIILPELTAQWEQKLQQIEDGTYKSGDFKKEMYEYVIKQTEDFIKNINTVISNNDTKEVIGTCPKCKGDIIVTDKYYLCKNYKSEDKISCDFVVGKKTNGANISKAEMIKILNGKETKTLNFKNKKGKNFKAKLKYDEEEKRVTFYFGKKGTDEILGKCPKCNSNVLDKGTYSSCEKYKDGCDFGLNYQIMKANLTFDDIRSLLNGKNTEVKTFIWKSGKKGQASLYYNKDKQKLEFVFPEKKLEKIGVCPKCKKDVIDYNNYCKCSECDFSISYQLLGAKLTKKDIQALLEGKETKTLNFKNKKGKNFKAKLKYENDKLNFIFE